MCTATPNEACRNGTVDCSTGSAVCTDAGNKPNGTTCPGGVCNGGMCMPCSQGASCGSNPNPACRNGYIECGSGLPVCTDGSSKMNGTPCAGGVCNGGSCNPCNQGASCAPSLCQTGTIDCGSGSAVCLPMGVQPPGTPCPGGVCNSGGVCIPCVTGATCTTNPGYPCQTGTISCSTGTPVCSDTVAIPLVHSPATCSKCGVPPRITAPSATTAS